MVSYSGYASAVDTGTVLALNFDTNGVQPDAFQAGDILVAAVRANRPLSGSAFGGSAGWTVVNGTTAGDNALGLFWRRFTTAADFTATHTFSGWTNGGAVGVMTCFRGLDPSVAVTNTVRNNTGLISARTDSIRPNLDLAVLSYVRDADGVIPDITNTGGMTQGAYTVGRIGADSLLVGLAHRENVIASPALTQQVQFNVSAPVRDQRFVSTVMRVSGPSGPPTGGTAYAQPFQGLYVGSNAARMYRGSTRIF